MRISEITIGDGRRALNDAAVERLVESIGAVGLINPISVDKSGTLVAGLHRLKACEALGWTEIPVIVLDVDEVQAELAEIDEDLCRHDGTALERAERLARRKVLYEKLHPETRAGVAGATAKRGRADPESGSARAFIDDTAAKTGRSRSVIAEEVKLARDLAPDVRDALRETPLADNKRALAALADEPVERQRELVAAGPEAVREAAKEKLAGKPSQITPEERARLEALAAEGQRMLRGEPAPAEDPRSLQVAFSAINRALEILSDEAENPAWRIEDAIKVLLAAQEGGGR